MTWLRARTLHRLLLAAALVVKGLSWPAVSWPLALSLAACGVVAATGIRARYAFAVAAGLIWVTIATDTYTANHFYLLGLLTSFAALVPARASGPAALGEQLSMVQVSAVYFWAAVWKLNAAFLSGSVLAFEWSRSWLLGPAETSTQLALALSVGAIVSELTLAAILWSRRLVVPWAVALAAVLHVGMIATVGADAHTTGELVAFALACGSTFPFFVARRAEPFRRTARSAVRPSSGAVV